MELWEVMGVSEAGSDTGGSQAAACPAGVVRDVAGKESWSQIKKVSSARLRTWVSAFSLVNCSLSVGEMN